MRLCHLIAPLARPVDGEAGVKILDGILDDRGQRSTLAGKHDAVAGRVQSPRHCSGPKPVALAPGRSQRDAGACRGEVGCPLQ
jgi:hypothetical protein